MSGSPGMPPDRVPTLTEVVPWPAERVPADGVAVAVAAAGAGAGAGSVAEAALAPIPASVPVLAKTALAEPPPIPPASPAVTEAQLTHRILTDVQRQIDLMLEYRLREALAPVLARATDNLVRESRGELASTLRDVVARAVAQEMSRHRSR